MNLYQEKQHHYLAHYFAHLFGEQHFFKDIREYEEFKESIPVRDYEKYRKNVHWTGALITNMNRSALVGGAVIALSKIYDQHDPDVDDALEGARGYDFFWAKYDFPGMKLEQVAALIESEAKKAHQAQ